MSRDPQFEEDMFREHCGDWGRPPRDADDGCWPCEECGRRTDIAALVEDGEVFPRLICVECARDRDEWQGDRRTA